MTRALWKSFVEASGQHCYSSVECRVGYIFIQLFNSLSKLAQSLSKRKQSPSSNFNVSVESNPLSALFYALKPE